MDKNESAAIPKKVWDNLKNFKSIGSMGATKVHNQQALFGAWLSNSIPDNKLKEAK